MRSGLFIFIFLIVAPAIFPWLAISQNSVLSTGSWFKISIESDGIYKIDRDFLESTGIEVGSIDPRNIALYGYGGGMLPQANSDDRFDDLPENSILVVGESDGSFDDDDYILFYGQGPDLARYSSSGEFEYQNNLYSDQSFYFLTVQNQPGKRPQNISNEGSNFATVDSYDDFVYSEEDLVNLIGAGREWYGDRFGSATSIQDLSWDIEGILPRQITVTSAVMSQSFGSSSFDISLNGSPLGSQLMSAIPDAIYDIKGFDRVDQLSIEGSVLNDLNDGLTLTHQFNRASSGTSAGFMNYVVIEFQRRLALYNNQTTFRSLPSLDNSFTTFEIQSSTNDATVWDITDPINALNQEFSLSGNNIVFGASSLELKEYVIFQGEDFPEPEFEREIANQNLHGLSVPDGLIITHEDFMEQAERLAVFRESNDNLDVAVVTIDQIYHEFSSGRQDITAIRDFVRHLYTRDNKLSYVLLFGDASYDYKDRTVGENTNFVPIYEARNSLHPIFSYGSDDYFGFMEEAEGTWEESETGDHTMEIGIGRLPVTTNTDATILVDKLINYATNSDALGDWRNEVYFVADDGDFNIHQRDADQLANMVDAQFSQFNPNKIYLDAFPQTPLPNGKQSAQGVSEAIDEAINDGALVFNFTGHGNENLWCDEEILDQNQIRSWNNETRLPLFVTATCEFGRYDDPTLISGGELLILSEAGGAIGLLTTSRPVFSNTNFLLNRAFYNHVFQKEEGEFLRLGDIFRITKNESLRGPVNRNFSLLGDPMMTLAYPEYEVNITDLNGSSLNAEGDTISALGLTRFSGVIVDQANVQQNSFNGVLSIKAFDIPNEVATLGNESSPTIFEERSNLIFKGDVTIENGAFDFEFVVPRNISYLFQEGKISLYAQSDDGVDANGANIDLRIGGTDPNAPDDSTPPQLELFLNTESFRSGDETGPNPLLIAHVSDENGINISNTGIGQSITATLDGNTNFNLNEFYSANIDSYQEGIIRYPLSNLEEGEHQLTLRLFDTHNNPTERTINFFVSKDAKNAIFNVTNYPNPLRDRTTFSFSHNRLGENLDLTVEIYDLRGDLVKTLNTQLFDSTGTIDQLSWDRTNSRGSRVKTGIYISRIILKTTEGVSTAHQKLIVIN